MKTHLAALLIALASPAVAHEFILEDLLIIHPSIPETPVGADRAAVYMVLVNDTDRPERLLRIETPAGPVRFERPVTGEDGSTAMQPMAWVQIPPGEVVILGAGEIRGRIDGLTQTVIEGGEVEGTLVFENRGRFPMFFLGDPLEVFEEPEGSSLATVQDRAADVLGIATALRAEFGPDVMIGPIVAEADVAIAGWQVQDRAARAFLRRAPDGWRIEIWAGASLILPATLASLGVGRERATRLRAELAALEEAIGLTARFDAFPGTVIAGPSP